VRLRNPQINVLNNSTYFWFDTKVLIIYEDAHVKDSMEYLEEKLRLINEGLIKDETDTKMMKIYQSKILLYIYQEKWLVVYLSP
jgi:hypothetical protein